MENHDNCCEIVFTSNVEYSKEALVWNNNIYIKTADAKYIHRLIEYADQKVTDSYNEDP